jgi:hypothetical protein
LLDDDINLGVFSGDTLTSGDDHSSFAKESASLLKVPTKKFLNQRSTDATATDNQSMSETPLLSPKGGGPESPSMYNKKMFGMLMYDGQVGLGGSNFGEGR